MATPKISAMTFDGSNWSGWSNSKGQRNLLSMNDAVAKVQNDPELGFRIIDADNLKIYLSDMAFAQRAIQSAKTNFGVDIPMSSVFVGYP